MDYSWVISSFCMLCQSMFFSSGIFLTVSASDSNIVLVNISIYFLGLCSIISCNDNRAFIVALPPASHFIYSDRVCKSYQSCALLLALILLPNWSPPYWGILLCLINSCSYRQEVLDNNHMISIDALSFPLTTSRVASTGFQEHIVWPQLN